jgi:hypothetical protein
MGRSVLDQAAMADLVRDPAVDRAVHSLADEILAEAQDRSPVATGALRASGFVEGDDSEYRIGFDRDYAAEVEFGTDDTTAQPYLTPAALKDRGPL